LLFGSAAVNSQFIKDVFLGLIEWARANRFLPGLECRAPRSSKLSPILKARSKLQRASRVATASLELRFERLSLVFDLCFVFGWCFAAPYSTENSENSGLSLGPDQPKRFFLEPRFTLAIRNSHHYSSRVVRPSSRMEETSCRRWLLPGLRNRNSAGRCRRWFQRCESERCLRIGSVRFKADRCATSPCRLRDGANIQEFLAVALNFLETQ
jgi:hypothetical protein